MSYWKIEATFLNGNKNFYFLENLQFSKIPKIIEISQEEEIGLKIFKVTNGEIIKLFDNQITHELVGVKA